MDGDLVVMDRIEYVPGQTLTVNGKVTFGAEGQIVVPDGLRSGLYKLISASEVVFPNRAGWNAVVGSGDNVRIARLRVDADGGVWLCLGNPGFFIIFL